MSQLTPVERYRWMVRIRAFEQVCGAGVPTREIHGELHLGTGQEAISAGMAGWLRNDDALVSTHRNHGHALIKGVDPRALLAEIFERRTGLCGGFGGHMHPFDPDCRFSATGIVGASLPIALGHAYAAVLADRHSVAVAVTGDGGANHGTFHECLNMAAAWILPLIIVVENNGLAISVMPDQVVATHSFAARAEAYGCVGESVDGTDADAVGEAFGRLVEAARTNRAPAVLEATCVRFQGHYEGDVQVYRTAEDLDERDPLLLGRRRLMAAGVSAAELDQIQASAVAEMEGLLADVRRDPLPDPAEALSHVFAESGGNG